MGADAVEDTVQQSTVNRHRPCVQPVCRNAPSPPERERATLVTTAVAEQNQWHVLLVVYFLIHLLAPMLSHSNAGC